MIRQPHFRAPIGRRHLAGSASLLFLLAFLAACSFGQKSSARDAWQRPEQVMDAIGVHAGSVVADVGAGSGYFTFHLAERVGPAGKVYAEDIVEQKVDAIRKTAGERHLAQIEALTGTAGDPRLPAESLDAILVVNAYHEFLDYDAMQKAMYAALKPGGLLAIIDCKADPGQPRAAYQNQHRLPEQITIDDAGRNGFHFLRRLEGFSDPDSSREYYFLLFEKPKPAA